MEEERGKQRRLSDDGVTLRPAAWRLLDEHTAQVLDALPVTRIFAAFVDEAHTLVPALFCLCLRAAVPFVVVDALLQDRYRLASCGDVSARRDPHGPGGSNVDSAFVGHDRAVDHCHSVRKPLPWPSPWVSHCPCRPRCYPWKSTDRHDPMPCPRGRLVRVPPRTALRIATWHWVSAVTGCVDTTLRWASAADVGPYPVPHPQKAADGGGYARDRGAVVRVRPDGTSLIGVWPCGAGAGDDGAHPFEHYGTPVERLPHPWDARIHVDLYDRTRPTDMDGGGGDEDMQAYLPFAVARVDDDPVFLVAVYQTTVMVM